MRNRRNRKKRLLLLFILPVLLLSTGCTAIQSKRELDAIAIVLGLGMDQTEDGALKVTAQVARTGALKGNGASDAGGGMYWNISMKGKDLYPMMRDAVQQSNRTLYISHNQVILLGEDLARSGVRPYIDYFFREREMRYDVLLAVSEDPAAEVLQVSPNMEVLPSQELSKLLKIQEQSALAPVTSLFQFGVDQKSARKAALVPMIAVKREAGEKEEKETLYVNGCAVFRDWKMVGKLNDTEIRGFLWANGEINSAAFTVPVDDLRVSLSVTQKDGSMTVRKNEMGNTVVRFSVRAEAVIGNIDGTYDFSRDGKVEKIEKNCSDFIRNEIENTIAESRRLQSDIFGISDFLAKKMPNEWKIASADWDAYFNKIKYVVAVETTIRRTGSLINPVFESGENHD